MFFLRPLLGLLQGLIIYWVIKHTHFTNAGTLCAIIVLTFPLLALQIKLPSPKTIVPGLAILIVMGLIYGYAAYHLISAMQASENFVTPILAVQCVTSAFIVFVFYCVVIEEEQFHFPYSTLFSEAWQILLKILLGQVLVCLTWGLCVLASGLFKLLNISLISDIVFSDKFVHIMLPFFFGISMTILHQYEDILTKLRNILLAFCKFLYPIFVIISLSFLLVIPFANKNFADFWQVIIGLSILNILLFNGIFQAGFTASPYTRWFSLLIYASFIITTLYSFYVLKFPLTEMRHYGFKPGDFLLFLLLLFLFAYNLCYSLAIFLSPKPWLTMIKSVNTILAVVIALIYLALALPLFDISKLAAKFQLSRLLNNQAIANPEKPYTNPGYLVGVNLQNANLEGKDLGNINFSNANLQGANLAKATLQNADLSKANLKQANLNCTNLQNANFYKTNLSQAKLSNANLTLARFNNTNLSQVNFAGANLESAWFNQVTFKQTNFTNANLNNSYGLKQEDLANACGTNVTLPDKLSITACTRLDDISIHVESRH